MPKLTPADLKALVALVGVIVLAAMNVLGGDAVVTFLGGLLMSSPLREDRTPDA